MNEFRLIVQAISVVASMLAGVFWLHSALFPFSKPRKPPFALLARIWSPYGRMVASQEKSNAGAAAFAAVAALSQAINLMI